MTASFSQPPKRITCEHLTDEIIAEYQNSGFTLAFAEEVMCFDLSQAIPSIALPSDIACLPWNAEHIPAFFAVYQAAFRERPGFPYWSMEQWVHWHTNDATFRPDLTLLAMAQEQPVAFIASTDDAELPQQIGWIGQLGVHPQWRGRGLAAALISQNLLAWRSEGKHAVMLDVNVNNPGAMHLYQRLGFTVVGRRGAFYSS